MKKKAVIKERMSEFLNDNAGIGVVEIILILVILIALVLIFKQQITAIVDDAFKSITQDANSIIN